jgi:predicted nucleic acid-binding protein
LNLVIDASVAAKWFLPDEPFSESALELLRQAAAGTTNFIVPDLFFSECGNILWKAARRKRLSGEETLAAIQLIEELQLMTVPAAGLLENTMLIARNYYRSFYDSLYLAVAAKQQAVLITADEKLANATAAYLPVKWIGSIYN